MQLTGLVTGLVLFVVTSIVSLAIFAINAKINQKHLEQENALLQLELRVEREFISKPHLAEIVDRFENLVARLEAQVNLSEQVRVGFDGIRTTLTAKSASHSLPPA